MPGANGGTSFNIMANALEWAGARAGGSAGRPIPSFYHAAPFVAVHAPVERVSKEHKDLKDKLATPPRAPRKRAVSPIPSYSGPTA